MDCIAASSFEVLVTTLSFRTKVVSQLQTEQKLGNFKDKAALKLVRRPFVEVLVRIATVDVRLGVIMVH